MGTEFLIAIFSLGVSFVLIVILLYHALVRFISSPKHASALASILVVIWAIGNFISFMFVPFVRIINFGYTSFTIASMILVVVILAVAATQFISRR